MVSVGLILKQVTHISCVEVTGETSLNILDLLGYEGVVVVLGGLIDELLVQRRLEESVEVAHESGVVAELVLGEQGQQTVVALLADLVLLLDDGEVEHGLNERDKGHTVNQGDHSSLQARVSF